MNKLKIEHLSAYLPYEVLFMCNNKVYQMTVVDTLNDYPVWAGRKYNKKSFGYEPTTNDNLDDGVIGQGFKVRDIKLCLRPLSDLTKEIEHNGERFIPIMRIFGGEDYEKYDYSIEIIDRPILGKKICITVKDAGEINFGLKNIMNNRLTVGNWQSLFEWHFDVFNLIEAGLAVDINTLKQL